MTTDIDTSTFDEWVILELMGHRRLAGHLTEVEIAGKGFLRIDVPGGGGPDATQFISPASVYAITPTTEETARKVATLSRPQPVTPWELERHSAAGEVKALHVGEDDDDWDDSDDT